MGRCAAPVVVGVSFENWWKRFRRPNSAWEIRRDSKELAQRDGCRLYSDGGAIRLNAHQAANGAGAAAQPNRNVGENGWRIDAGCRLGPPLPDWNRGVGELVSDLRCQSSRRQSLRERHPVRNWRVDFDDGPCNANGRGRSFRHGAGHHGAHSNARSPPDLWSGTGRHLWTRASRSAAAVSGDASVALDGMDTERGASA